MAELLNLWKFVSSADYHASFVQRVAAAVQEYAVDLRANIPAAPTAQEAARHNWAVWALKYPLAAAVQLLPGLAVMANNAGFLNDEGEITVSDTQIRGVVDDDLIDRYAGFIPEV